MCETQFVTNKNFLPTNQTMSRTVVLGLLLVLAVVIAEQDDIIIGIDLGTTYSCVAWWDAKWNRTEIIPNDQGNMITPSVVAFIPETGELLVGAAAKNQAAMNPENTVFDAKRYVSTVCLTIVDLSVESLMTLKYKKTLQIYHAKQSTQLESQCFA